MTKPESFGDYDINKKIKISKKTQSCHNFENTPEFGSKNYRPVKKIKTGKMTSDQGGLLDQ